jgi:hypothetical protein
MTDFVPIMREKPNILIIGASGGVAAALLRRVVKHRSRMGRMVLVDREESVLQDSGIQHRDVAYEFIKAGIDVKNNGKAYVQLLTAKDIDIVVDLSINETRPMLEVTDAQGVCYVNTGVANVPGENFAEVVLDIYRRKDAAWRTAHILCAGMNPGIANMWVRHGIETYGVPEEVLHFEYDTAQPRDGWYPVITWSRDTFLDEIVNDPAGYMEGRDKVRALYPNPLKHRFSMAEVLRPLIALDDYPRGFLLLHEENITIAQTFDVPSRFLFAMDRKSMDQLETIYDERGEVPRESLALGDNKKVALKGSVTIGVRLGYRDRQVFFYNTTSHEQVRGCSGSCWQVAAGLEAVLTTLLTEHLEKHIYFVENLYHTGCKRAVLENLLTQQLIVDLSAGKGRRSQGGQ